MNRPPPGDGRRKNRVTAPRPAGRTTPRAAPRPVPRRPRRRGSAMFVVMLVLIVLTALSVAFYQMSREARASAFLIEQKSILRELAEAASDEAFARLSAATADPTSAASQWLTGPRTGELALSVPLTAGQAGSMLRSDLEARFAAVLRCVDARTSDSKGSPFAPGEALGTAEIAVTVELHPRWSGWKKTTPYASCSIIRHHDFKVVSVVSPRQNASPRTAYAHNWVLDYVLLLRHGLREFRQQNGEPLNPSQTTVVIDQNALAGTPERLGKIFIGGTADPSGPSTAGPNETPRGNHVFANIDESMAALIPPFQKVGTRRIGLDECCLLLPRLNAARRYLTGLEGVFSARHVPLLRPPAGYQGSPEAEAELSARNGALNAAQGAEATIATGLYLLGKDPARAADSAFAAAILEGAIRQRFLYFSYFHLDLSRVSGASAQDIADLQRLLIPCIPPGPQPIRDDTLRAFTEGLARLEARYGNAPGTLPLTSRLQDGFLYQGGQSGPAPPAGAAFAAPRPAFFDYRGQPAELTQSGKDGWPFRHYGLWDRKLETADQLETFGILDRQKGELRLRGVIGVNDYVTLGAAGQPPLKIRGQGVLVAKGFRLLSGLEKAAGEPVEPICVLFARDQSILVETADPIQASLIALGAPGNPLAVLPQKALALQGCLAADELRPERWAPGVEHVLRYDPALKPGRPVLQINLARWITFQKIIESETPEGAT